MSKRIEKLSALIANYGERRTGDQQFGLYIRCLEPSGRIRRKIARRIMSARRHINRKHGIKISAWKWTEMNGDLTSNDPLGRVGYVAVSLYGQRPQKGIDTPSVYV